MLFSVNHNSSKKQEEDEIKCPVNQLGLIIKDLRAREVVRANIMVFSGEYLDEIIEQVELVKKAVGDNYTIECRNYGDLIAILKKGYHAYHYYPVTDWESFQVLVELGVSDIYIDGPLCFQAERVSKAAKEHNIKIRISPSVSPNISPAASPAPNSFFIRPEDLEIYSPYFDIIDFQASNQDQQDTLFSIYKKGSFLFDFNFIVETLHEEPILCGLISKEFAKNRLNCKQICKIPGESCHLCFSEFANARLVEKIVATHE